MGFVDVLVLLLFVAAVGYMLRDKLKPVVSRVLDRVKRTRD